MPFKVILTEQLSLIYMRQTYTGLERHLVVKMNTTTSNEAERQSVTN